ncbi:MAG TPA: alpha-amylase family glycosyl hydrolase [Vicinamibacteria bacterium]|nr:alpha-amylase family glycosyl hydrolase [Vicinamibacteria bacterium]
MARSAALALLSLALAAPAALAAGAQVTKVEPPSWWPGHTINPVRLLVRGAGLGGAAVVSCGPGLTAGAVRVNDAGTYLFLDLTIAPDAKPGPRAIAIRTRAGTATIPFELLSPLPREGRFQGFSPDDVIYLVMPDRFADGDPANDDPAVSQGLFDRARPRYYHGGDLQGVIDHLPYLKDLGVTALWLNPWYDNVNHLNERETYDGKPITDYHGYGAVDYYGVEEHFGDLATLRELVDEAHAAGIKVIQDQVANHSGPYHPWVQDPPTPTWYYGTPQNHLANTWQTWTLQDPHATPATQKATLQGWFIDILPDLNQDDREVARYEIQNTLWWVGTTGLDGIRQDTLPYVHRRFWREWMAAIKKEYPRLRVVGEMLDGDPALVSFFQGGVRRFDGIDSGVDTLFDFPLHFAIREAFARGGSLRQPAMMLARDHLYRDPSVLVTLLGLHDVPRFMSEPGATVAALKNAFTFLFTTRGTPLLYYGDEIAMAGGGDPDNRRDFPGGWKEDARSAFTAAGRTPDEQAVHQHVRTLLHLRQATPALRRGRSLNLQVDDRTWVYARVSEANAAVGLAVVAINTASTPATLEVALDGIPLGDGVRLVDRIGSAEAVVQGSRLHLALPPASSAVFTP